MVQLSYDIFNGVGIDAHYVLVENILISSSVGWFPIGTEGAYPFMGTFDGKGHSLMLGALGVTSSGGAFPRDPIFGLIDGAVIRNIKIEKPPESQFISSFITASTFGILVSHSVNSYIYNIWLKDFKPIGITNSSKFGLIAGKLEGYGFIRNCLISNLDISITTMGTVEMDMICPQIPDPSYVTNCLVTSVKMGNAFRIASTPTYGNIYCDLSGNSKADSSVIRHSLADISNREILTKLGNGYDMATYITEGIPYLKAFFWEGQI